MKKCPYCDEEIQDDAIKCRYCGEWLDKIEPVISEPDKIEPEKIETVTTKVTKIEPSKKLKTDTTDTEFFHRSPQADTHFDPTLPRPWNRFWARSIDYALFFLIFYLIILGLNSAGVPTAFSENIFIDMIISYFALIACLILFEAVWITYLSTTPGKAWFGIRVLAKSGEKLSFTDATVRSLSVLLYGYALLVAFPIGPIITMWYSLKYINKNNVAKWDKKTIFQVTHRKLNPFRYWSGVLVGSVLFVILIVSLTAMYGYNKRTIKERLREKHGLVQKKHKIDWDSVYKHIEARDLIDGAISYSRRDKYADSKKAMDLLNKAIRFYPKYAKNYFYELKDRDRVCASLQKACRTTGSCEGFNWVKKEGMCQ